MKETIRDEIARFVAEYMDVCGTETMWQTPLVGFASTDDPAFVTLKEVVSPSHAMPENILPGARSAVVYFLPFAEEVVKSNRGGELASREWAAAYVETNRLIVDTNAHMSVFLRRNGIETSLLPPTHNFDPETLLSDWSHRHIAVIAGLGRFGLNNMLITEKGCCGRLGSFLTTFDLEPDSPKESEACLYHYDGSCGLCVERCVNGALFTDRFDRHKCYEMCLRNEAHNREFGKADVCGKCVVGLPCSVGDPVGKKSR